MAQKVLPMNAVILLIRDFFVSFRRGSSIFLYFLLMFILSLAILVLLSDKRLSLTKVVWLARLDFNPLSGDGVCVNSMFLVKICLDCRNGNLCCGC